MLRVWKHILYKKWVGWPYEKNHGGKNKGQGKCVDAKECLFKHEATNYARTDKNKNFKGKLKCCSKGLKCPRSECEIGDDGHKRIGEVPCKYQLRCTKQNCPFKHDTQCRIFGRAEKAAELYKTIIKIEAKTFKTNVKRGKIWNPKWFLLAWIVLDWALSGSH